jgi:hypothetical protein
MLCKLSRSIAARRKAVRELAAMRWIAQADPIAQSKEINAKVNQILPGLSPSPRRRRDDRQALAALVTEYERRKAKGFFADPAAADAIFYGRKKTPPKSGGI